MMIFKAMIFALLLVIAIELNDISDVLMGEKDDEKSR